MKTLFTFLLLISTLWCRGQDSVEDSAPDNVPKVIDSISFQQTQDVKYCSGFSNGDEFKKYISSDGIILKIGDTLIIGKPSTYTNAFTYLYFGKYSLGKALLTGAPIPLQGSYQAEKVLISRIFVNHLKASSASQLGVLLYIKNPNIGSLINNHTVMDYEKALQLGEIINPRSPMTSDQALQELKKEKDKLDLGLITQAQYDKRKAELAKFIK